mmetsp:Transcript_14829/g.43279  ORF Transcript_14829/g.43279 Transcript_14829/m.43279 type:complete len:208 (+) Transcript_14829:4728-5351(+)
MMSQRAQRPMNFSRTGAKRWRASPRCTQRSTSRHWRSKKPSRRRRRSRRLRPRRSPVGQRRLRRVTWRSSPRASRPPCRRRRRSAASTSMPARPCLTGTRRTGPWTGRRSTPHSLRSRSSGSAGYKHRPLVVWIVALRHATAQIRVAAAARWATGSRPGTSSCTRASGSGHWNGCWTRTTSQNLRARPVLRPARRPASWASTRHPWP